MRVRVLRLFVVSSLDTMRPPSRSTALKRSARHLTASHACVQRDGDQRLQLRGCKEGTAEVALNDSSLPGVDCSARCACSAHSRSSESECHRAVTLSVRS